MTNVIMRISIDQAHKSLMNMHANDFRNNMINFSISSLYTKQYLSFSDTGQSAFPLFHVHLTKFLLKTNYLFNKVASKYVQLCLDSPQTQYNLLCQCLCLPAPSFPCWSPSFTRSEPSMAIFFDSCMST